MRSLVGLLKMYDHRGLNDIDMPGSPILNSLIALISYLAHVALMISFGCAVSQEVWLWLSRVRTGSTCKSQVFGAPYDPTALAAVSGDEAFSWLNSSTIASERALWMDV